MNDPAFEKQSVICSLFTDPEKQSWRCIYRPMLFCYSIQINIFQYI